MAHWRLQAAIALGKASGFASRRLRRGGGTALPGLVALRVSPSLVRELAAQLGAGSILVTGTNGKTTTTRMISSILRQSGLTPLHNKSGSNLIRGLATALLVETGISGRLSLRQEGIGLFEVDEATLPQAIAETRPRVIVITNLFRDQLDRYGEVDYVASLWRKALAGLTSSTTLVLNSDDPLVASLPVGGGLACTVLHYGIDDITSAQPEMEHAADSRRCPGCGNDYRYTAAFYGHVGHYLCSVCGTERPQPEVAALSVTAKGAAESDIEVRTPQGDISLHGVLPGIYNVYNVLAAVTAGISLGISPQQIAAGLAASTAAFGRVEKVTVRDRTLYMVLAKNPAGLNEVLRTLTSDGDLKPMVFMLNDGIADGRDISWIWDADFEKLRAKVTFAIASGRRAHDMGLRLKYAGVAGVDGDTSSAPLLVTEEIGRALEAGLSRIGPGETLYVVPTYTAMLETQELLTAWGYLKPYWQRM